MLKKLLTKPVWYWERKREYPIRQRYMELPSITVTPSSARLVVLTTPAALPDALWAAWSWYRFLQPIGFELHLAVDGDLEQSLQEQVSRIFPGIKVYNVNPVVAQLCQGRPALATFMQHNPVAKQVGIALALSREGAVIYSDHDVYAFNRPDELIARIHSGTPSYFLDSGVNCHDLPLLESLCTLGVEYTHDLNAGFLYIPHNAVSIGLAEEILCHWNPIPKQYFTPQTVQSVLMHAAQAQVLPKDRYIISNCRQFYWEQDVDYGKIAARHFTGPVRHVLYKFGMSFLLEQSRQQKTV
jgi:hypothetical protein